MKRSVDRPKMVLISTVLWISSFAVVRRIMTGGWGTLADHVVNGIIGFVFFGLILWVGRSKQSGRGEPDS